MAKKVILDAGRTFSEFSLLTDYTSKNCNLNNINLKSHLKVEFTQLPRLPIRNQILLFFCMQQIKWVFQKMNV